MLSAGLRRQAFLATAIAALVACNRSSLSPEVPDGGQPAATVTPVVVALGDSLTAGPGLRAEQTWPALLQQRATAARYPHLIVNAGVSGDASSDAVRRLDRALVADTRVLIVALGANDGLRGVPIATLRRNLETIVERAQSRGIKVLLCGMETPPSRGWDYSVQFHRVFPEIAARYAVPLMPFLLTGVVFDPDYNLGDGFHPNAAGHRRIAENMWPYLEPLLR